MHARRLAARDGLFADLRAAPRRGSGDVTDDQPTIERAEEGPRRHNGRPSVPRSRALPIRPHSDLDNVVVGSREAGTSTGRPRSSTGPSVGIRLPGGGSGGDAGERASLPDMTEGAPAPGNALVVRERIR